MNPELRSLNSESVGEGNMLGIMASSSNSFPAWFVAKTFTAGVYVR